MTSNPYESPKLAQPPESEPWLSWVKTCFGGIGLLLAGIFFLGCITVTTFAPGGYRMRDIATVIAWFMIAIGLTVALIGGIGEFRSSSR